MSTMTSILSIDNWELTVIGKVLQEELPSGMLKFSRSGPYVLFNSWSSEVQFAARETAAPASTAPNPYL